MRDRKATSGKRRRPASVLVAGILISMLGAGSAHPSIPQFFEDLFREMYPLIEQQHQGEFQSLCGRYALDPGSEHNRSTYFRLVFLHDLLKGDGASNCRRGGALEIPYFWHWVDPNPRHDILAIPDSLRLVELQPPSGYARYRTFADIDRRPTLYLADLVSARPRYAHADCGEFHTFGWCSEREMAFVALLGAAGYRGKVVQEGIHTWSEFLVSFIDIRGGATAVEVAVDNTFGEIRWSRLEEGESPPAWLSDVGDGTEIRWYNRIARSAQERQGLVGTRVSEEARSRIRDAVRRRLTEGDRRDADPDHASPPRSTSP